MNINRMIQAALEAFGDPVVFEVYAGDKKIYYVYNYASVGADYADDGPNHEVYLVQVHLFGPLNWDCIRRMAQTRAALRRIGGTCPTVTTASDEDGRHIVFEFELAQEATASGEL